MQNKPLRQINAILITSVTVQGNLQ